MIKWDFPSHYVYLADVSFYTNPKYIVMNPPFHRCWFRGFEYYYTAKTI